MLWGEGGEKVRRVKSRMGWGRGGGVNDSVYTRVSSSLSLLPPSISSRFRRAEYRCWIRSVFRPSVYLFSFVFFIRLILRIIIRSIRYFILFFLKYFATRRSLIDGLCKRMFAGPNADTTTKTDPKFNGTLQNVTATVGRRATLSCTIENLGAHKVSGTTEYGKGRQNFTVLLCIKNRYYNTKNMR